jgi:signal transduction histidine kinase
MKPINNRLTELTFVILLLITVGQVLWWVYDQVDLIEKQNAMLVELYQQESIALTNMKADQVFDPSTMLPHLEVTHGVITVASSALDELESIGNSRANRYYWEGGFFLFVLLLGIGIIMRTIYQDRELRRRQQNFIASISHELKTPLATMRLAAESLELSTSQPSDKKLISRILSEGDRLLHLISNLLDTSKLDENKFTVSRIIFSPSSIITKCLSDFSERIELYGINISINLDENIKINNDPTIYAVIVRNLLENAIKACQQKNTKEIAISLALKNHKILTIITDNGIGIEPNELSNIFEKFYRVGNENTRSTSGSGLGLYICKKLCDLTSMSIIVKSEGLGKGSSFYIEVATN